jgi:hypothetical protein
MTWPDLIVGEHVAVVRVEQLGKLVGKSVDAEVRSLDHVGAPLGVGIEPGP